MTQTHSILLFSSAHLPCQLGGRDYAVGHYRNYAVGMSLELPSPEGAAWPRQGGGGINQLEEQGSNLWGLPISSQQRVTSQESLVAELTSLGGTHPHGEMYVTHWLCASQAVTSQRPHVDSHAAC